MTVKQIKSILADFNYEPGVLIPFSEIASIVLENNTANIYPDKTTNVMFKLDNGCELLLVYYGTTNVAGQFIKESDLPRAIISIDKIQAIMTTTNTRMKSSYSFGID